MMLVGDWSPVHADGEFVAERGFPSRLLHGSLGISVALGMQTSALELADPMIGALGLSEWSFKAPLFIGDTVFVAVEVLEKRIASSKDKYILRRKLSLTKTAGLVCQEGFASALLQLPSGAK
jgi:acyl dehydratase